MECSAKIIALLIVAGGYGQNVLAAQCGASGGILGPAAQGSLQDLQKVTSAQACDANQIKKDFISDYQNKIKPIFDKKCVACHDSGAAEPFYAELPIVDTDIASGRTHLNMAGGFPFSSRFTSSQRALMDEIGDEAAAGTMPPPQYVHLHRIGTGHWETPSYLLDSEKKTILAWVASWKDKLSCYDLAKSDQRNPATIVKPIIKPSSPITNVNAGSAQNARSAIKQCVDCHSDGGDSPNLSDKNGNPDLSAFKKNASLLKEAIARMKSSGSDHMPKGDTNSSRTALDAQTLEAWLKNGSPVN